MSENPYESVTESQNIPDRLKVPPGNVLLLRAYGTGVQKYGCPASAAGAFTGPVPHAILLTGDRDEGDLVAIHLGDLPGKLWMVARSWAMPRMQPILQPRIRMALTGYCSLPNRRQAVVCLVGSPTYNGSIQMVGNLLRRAATRQTIRLRRW